MQARFRGGREGGKPPKFGRGAAVFVSLLAAGWFASGVFMVDEGELGVITTFGAFTSVATPGLGVHLPWPIQDIRVERVTLQRRVEIGARESSQAGSERSMLTRDESILDVSFTVLWQVKDVQDFVFNVRQPEELVRAVAESAMREVVGQRNLDAIITTERSQVEQSTRELMQRVLDAYDVGVEITQVQLQEATAPNEVIDAFNDVLRAEQDAEALINQANRYRNEVVPQARGQAAQLLQEAQAYREQAVRDANGDAERFAQVYEQYRANPRVTRERLYLETMERVMAGADKVIIDGRSGAVPYLPLDQLRRPAPAEPSVAPRGGQR